MSVARSEEMAGHAASFDAMAAARRHVIASDQMVEGEYPIFADRSQGAYLWDVDDNRYIDFFLSYGTVLLGHQHPEVDEAVVREIRRGFATGLMKQTQLELAQELIDVVPGAEMALFGRTGSDATGSAVRLARSFTGRDRVVRWGYNGWHDWCAQWDRGIPAATRELVDQLTYNDLESLRALFEKHPGQIACVIMMPFVTEPPAPGFLEGVRELTREHGALLIFDEMRSCFRMALGGAQEYFGVTADLVTYSKGMANGYAISALLGRADVLSHLHKVHISSTFFVNTLAMSAALATIRTVRKTNTVDTVWRLGTALQDGLRSLVTTYGAPAEVVGYPPMPYLEFRDADPDRHARAKQEFYTATIRAGVFFHPSHHWYVSAATTDADIETALAAARDGFAAVERAGLCVDRANR